MKKIVATLTLAFTLNSFAAPKCVGHRGFPAAALENSMRSLVEAVKAKADAVEFDIHLTKDGTPILMHDHRLRRTVKSKKNKNCDLFAKRIKSINYSDILENCELKNGEDIPSLDVALEYLSQKDIEVMIELKNKPNKQILDSIEKFYANNLDKVMILSGNYERINLFKKLDDKNISSQIRFFQTDLLPINKNKAENASYWFIGENLTKSKKNNENRQIYVWTLNNEKLLKKYLNQDIDYVGTNRVDMCLKIKAQLNQ